jgi:hypothetical protein
VTARWRRLRNASITALAPALVAVSSAWWLPALSIGPAGDGETDAAVIIEGEVPPGPDAGLVAERFRSGAVRSVVCASPAAFVGVYPADATCRTLGRMGVPEDRRFILHLPRPACEREVLPPIAALARAQGWTSLLLVVVPEGSRAFGRVARRDLAAAGVRAVVTYAGRDRAALVDRWWRAHRQAQRLVGGVMDDTLNLFYRECR